MTLPAELRDRTMSRIEQLGLRENAQQALTGSSGEPVGHVRVLHGELVAKLVQVTLTVPDLGLDSHMLFAFTPAGSAVPHFTLDAVAAGDGYAFHLDLIPRVELDTAPDYVRRVYFPLNRYRWLRHLDGLVPADLSPRQSALMSPWMMAYRADEQAFHLSVEPVRGYLEHWLQLVRGSVKLSELAPRFLAARDSTHRRELFGRMVDPVWNRLDSLLGDHQTERVRAELLTNALAGPPEGSRPSTSKAAHRPA